MAHVLIIGGHGKVALLAAPLLVADGHRVTSLIRNPDHADEVAATGADPKVADVQELDTDAMTELLEDVDVVVWSAGAGGGSPERTYAVDRDAAVRSMDAAARAGVGHYVMVSYYGAGLDHGVPEDDGFYAYAQSKAEADEHLRSSRLTWTILGPSGLTLDPGTGRIDADATEGGQVPRADVAAVIAGTVREGARLGGVTVEFNTGETPVAEALAAHRAG